MFNDKTIPIGVLFSQTGWTAVTERSMLSATLFAIKEINTSGGINGRLLEPVYADPKGEPSRYQTLARELIIDRGVQIILGCYTSSQRKAVLNVLDKERGLLCYPAQYEGFEYSRDVIYFGAVPNQHCLFLAKYLLTHFSPRVYIVGSDYVWPREVGRIMQDIIHLSGGEVLGQRYLREESRAHEFDTLIKDIIGCNPAIIFNNFVGTSNEMFYKAYVENGLSAQNMPVASLTTSEADIMVVGASAVAGHITAATYFHSQSNDTNTTCLKRYQDLCGTPPRANMCWEAAYIQAHMVAQALRRSESQSIHLVRSHILGAEFDAPQGPVKIDPLSSHMCVWPKIGIAGDNGQFKIVAEVHQAVYPDPYQALYSLDDELL